jgi:Cysteine rich repeat
MTSRSTCLVAALITLATAPVRAQLVAACRGDVQRFCEGTPLGGGRVARCLEENAAKLSAACKKAIGVEEAPPTAGTAGGSDASAGGAESARTACRSDAMTFCAEAIGDQTKMRTCLRSHAAQLSDGCKTALIAGGE